MLDFSCKTVQTGGSGARLDKLALMAWPGANIRGTPGSSKSPGRQVKPGNAV